MTALCKPYNVYLPSEKRHQRTANGDHAVSRIAAGVSGSTDARVSSDARILIASARTTEFHD